jgi:hypothetical protein
VTARKKQIAWQTLRENALEYRSSCEINENAGNLKTAIEHAHLGVELIFKAAIAKSGGRYPYVHDLVQLARTKVGARKFIYRQLGKNSFIRGEFLAVCSVWDVHLRYEAHVRSVPETIDLIEKFDRVFGWTLTNLIE